MKLNSNTTASNNEAIGYNAMAANTTGSSNVAVGSYALDANLTGSNNVALGTRRQPQIQLDKETPLLEEYL